MPAQSTYTPIQTFTANGTSSYTFTNIPQTYTDLRLVVFGRSPLSAADDGLGLFLTQTYVPAAATYSLTRLNGDGANATSTRDSGGDVLFVSGIPAASATSGIFGSTVIDIFNYASTSTFKSGIARSANDRSGSGSTRVSVFVWRNTSAITALNIFPNGGSQQFVAGSIVTLYGIAAA
jgi:hypothetical protein